MGKMNAPKRDYYAVRDQMQTGDVILWQGRSLFARMIRWFSEFSHASTVTRIRQYGWERVSVTEMLEGGMEFRTLSERIKKFKGRVFWYHIPATNEQRFLMGQYALEMLGQGVKYDYKGLFANIFGRISQNAKRFICSEWSWQDWIYGKYAEPKEPTKENPFGKAPRPGDIIPWDNSRGELTEIIMEEA